MNVLLLVILSLVIAGFILTLLTLASIDRTVARMRTNTHNQLEVIIMNQTELAAELRNVKAQIAKIGTETAATLQKVIDLEKVIAEGAPVSEEVLTALAELKTQAQATDDLTPDAP